MRKTPTLLLLLCLLVSNALLAIPAKRTNQLFTQPDGTKVTIVLQGDEHFSFYSTTDGVMLLKDNNGFMKYATINADGDFIPGILSANDPLGRSAEETAYIAKQDKEQISRAARKAKAESPSMKMPGPIGSSQFPNKGEVRGLIILAEFKDKKFSSVGTKEEFTNMMNQKGYSNYGATGSARDYFIDQSNSTFIPTFDVVGPVSLPQNMEYYGKRVGNAVDQNPAQMIVDACKLANSQLGTDFSQYDLDNDGKVDLVYVIYAGYAEAQGAPSNTVWPHAWDIAYGGLTLSLSNKFIRSYACSSELRDSQGTTIDGIGSFCHEFSHCLGLPDLYDAQGGSGYGLESWSLMDHGCYNNDSRTPPGYSAFERYSIGWHEPEYLTEPQRNITLEALNTSHKAFFVKSDSNEDEYYTLENRQQQGWDKYLPGHGLMITHINYDPASWTNNTVNTRKGYERVQIVPADGTLSTKNEEGDAYPGTSGNTSFTDVSTPASKLFSGGYLNKPISKIAEKDGVISFNFRSALCLPPKATDATQTKETEFTANWNEVEGAGSYTLEVAPLTTGEPVITEDFSAFTAGSNETPDATDISDNLDKFTQTTGWNGSTVFQAGGACILGDNNGSGELMTPRISLSNNKTFTLCIDLISTKAVAAGLKITLLDNPDATKPLAFKSITLPTVRKKVYWIFETDETNASIQVAVSNQSTINSITLYSGDVKSILESGDKPVYNGTIRKQTISGIATNTCKVEGLEKGTPYIYNVRTVMDDETSKASNKIVVTTQGVSGIQETSLKDRVYVSGNLIKIHAQQGEYIEIYTIDGVLKHSFNASQGENSIETENGIYIIRTGGSSIKAIITGR